MKKTISKVQLALFGLFSFVVSSHSQEHGALDTTFFVLNREAGSGFNGAVEKIKLQSDGKAVVAGWFTTYNGDLAPHLIKLNKNGVKDDSFNVGTGFTNSTTNPHIHSLLILSDDRVLIGGEFATYDGNSASNIVRLNPDGTMDQSFATGSGFNERVQSIVLQPDGKMLVGGQFTSYNLEPASYLVRLNPDGSKDPSFTVDSIVGSQVKKLGLQPDGKILVNTGNEVVRLNPDGSYDPSFTLPLPFGQESVHDEYGPQVNVVDLKAIEVLENGKILLGGFLQTSMKAFIPLVLLNPDGSRDSSFTTYQQDIGTGSYHDMILTAEGKIYTIGRADYAQGVLRFNLDGTRDLSFNAILGLNGQAIALQPDGKLIVSTSIGRDDNIARYNQDSSPDFSYNPNSEFDGEVTAVAVQNDGKILVGGEFNLYNGHVAKGVVRINTDGSVDHSFDPGTGLDGYGFGDRVSKIIIQKDGKILIVGSITNYNGAQVGSILRLNKDGSLDDSFTSGTGFNSFVDKDMALQEDGMILVSGSFSSYDGQQANKIIRLNSDGTRDLSFNIGNDVETRILTTYALPDGKVLIGGGTNGDATDVLVRLNPDGSRDTSFKLRSDLNINVLSIVVQTDNKFVVGGSAGNSVPDPRMVRLHPDGTIDPTFNAEIEGHRINSIVMQPDGKFLLTYDIYDNEKGLVRLNSDGSIDPTFRKGDTGRYGRPIHALAVEPDWDVIIGGEFTSFNQTKVNRIARLLNSVEEPDPINEIIRINAGGGEIVFDNERWVADAYFTGGKVYTRTNPIRNTENDALYQSERFGNVIYDIPVPEEGLYTAELHFAEIYWHNEGARQFRVAVEGEEPGPVIDLYRDHGGANAAYVLKLDNIRVADGKLTIKLITERENAKISGIAVFRQTSSPEPVKLRINSGGSELNFGEEQWLEDQYFTGGSTYNIQSGEINSTERDELYRSERFGNFTYSLPAPEKGLYTLELHLAEIYWDAPNNRIFDIVVENGQFELAAIDIYREYGGYRTATVIVAENIKVTDGFLDISVSTKKDNGKISGLVMYKQAEEVDPHDGFITRINSGGKAMQLAGEEWQADQYYSGGRTYTNTSEGIGNTDKDDIYFTERFGEFGYEIPVPATGLYTVELHFAEIHWKREGAREFDVDVENGQFALKNLDLYRELGGAHQAGIYIANNVHVEDGILNIDFPKVTENPKISGIVVYKQSTAGARLRTMDSLSKEAAREEDGKLVKDLNNEITLYPNPATDKVRLALYSEQTGEWGFVLVNSSGTTTHLGNFNLEIGEHLLEFDLSQYNLSAGVYYIQIVNKRGILTSKRVIIY